MLHRPVQVLGNTNLRFKTKGSVIVVPEATIPKSPLDQILEIETARIRLGATKQDVCTLAEIKPEMYSYTLKRGRQGHDLPEDCIGKIRRAIRMLERRKSA